MDGLRSGTTVSICPTAPSTNGRRSTRRRSLRTSGLVRFWPTLPRSRRSSTCLARPRPPGVVARQITCSKSDRHKEFRTTTRKGGYLTSLGGCLLYTSDAADEEDSVDLGGRRIIKKKKKQKK